MEQNEFLRKIEDIIPANTNLVSELTEVLDISSDSAYRRLRGSTLLTINEVSKLCKHYSISFDVFNDTDINNVTFSFLELNYSMESFEKYLASMLKDLKLIKNAKKHKITYACEDIPIFYNYKYPLLGAYKIFYWMEAILNTSNDANKKFSIDYVPKNIIELSKEIYTTYIETPSVEIWTETTYLSVLKQVEFFWDSGRFESDTDAIKVLDELKQLLTDIKLQAKVGKKLFSDSMEYGQKADYELYLSDIEIGNNCVLVDLGVTKSIYIGHMSFNTIATMNKNIVT
ncbi:MAG: hypothetical protein DRI86_01090 [Bacteroidetes bacterium]|nr:MAG: hypothetical protein DRI86_01090 [Bacteroidota bacterium]